MLNRSNHQNPDSGNRLFLFGLAMLFALTLSSPAEAGGNGVAITGAQVLLPDGNLEGDWAVIVGNDGKIQALVPGSTVDEKAFDQVYRAP